MSETKQYIFLAIFLPLVSVAFIDSLEINKNEVVKVEKSLEAMDLSSGTHDKNDLGMEAPIAEEVETTDLEKSLLDYKETKNEDVILEIIRNISKENKEQRDLWISKWPKSDNRFQELLLQTLSLKAYPVRGLGSFEDTLSEVGALIDAEERTGVNEYLNEMLMKADENGDLDTKTSIFRYNARHAVDYELGNFFVKDLKRIESGALQIEERDAKEMFDSLLNSHDIPYVEKMRFGEVLAEKASSADADEMFNELEKSVWPLVRQHL